MFLAQKCGILNTSHFKYCENQGRITDMFPRYLVYHSPGLLFLRVLVFQFDGVCAFITVVVFCLHTSCTCTSAHNWCVLTGGGGATSRQPGTGRAPTNTWVLWPLFKKHSGSCGGTYSHCSWYWGWDLTWKVYTQSTEIQLLKKHNGHTYIQYFYRGYIVPLCPLLE